MFKRSSWSVLVYICSSDRTVRLKLLSWLPSWWRLCFVVCGFTYVGKKRAYPISWGCQYLLPSSKQIPPYITSFPVHFRHFIFQILLKTNCFLKLTPSVLVKLYRGNWYFHHQEETLKYKFYVPARHLPAYTRLQDANAKTPYTHLSFSAVTSDRLLNIL